NLPRNLSRADPEGGADDSACRPATGGRPRARPPLARRLPIPGGAVGVRPTLCRDVSGFRCKPEGETAAALGPGTARAAPVPLPRPRGPVAPDPGRADGDPERRTGGGPGPAVGRRPGGGARARAAGGRF